MHILNLFELRIKNRPLMIKYKNEINHKTLICDSIFIVVVVRNHG